MTIRAEDIKDWDVLVNSVGDELLVVHIEARLNGFDTTHFVWWIGLSGVSTGTIGPWACGPILEEWSRKE